MPDHSHPWFDMYVRGSRKNPKIAILILRCKLGDPLNEDNWLPGVLAAALWLFQGECLTLFHSCFRRFDTFQIRLFLQKFADIVQQTPDAELPHTTLASVLTRVRDSLGQPAEPPTKPPTEPPTTDERLKTPIGT